MINRLFILALFAVFFLEAAVAQPATVEIFWGKGDLVTLTVSTPGYDLSAQSAVRLRLVSEANGRQLAQYSYPTSPEVSCTASSCTWILGPTATAYWVLPAEVPNRPIYRYEIEVLPAGAAAPTDLFRGFWHIVQPGVPYTRTTQVTAGVFIGGLEINATVSGVGIAAGLAPAWALGLSHATDTTGTYILAYDVGAGAYVWFHADQLGTAGGGGGGAPTNATYWTSTANPTLTSEVVISSLAALNAAIGASIADGAHTVEANDLTAAVTWANVPDANVDGASERDEVCNTADLDADCLVIDDSHAHTGATVSGLDASDTATGTFADARISETSVVQHQGALTITESQISDLGTYLADPGAGGIVARTGVGATAARVLTSGSLLDFQITNGDGASGNPTFSFLRSATLASNPAMTPGHAMFGADGILFEGQEADNTIEGLLQAPALLGERTWTLPDASGTILVTSAIQTVTNKSIGLATNTITGSSANMATAISDETGTGLMVFSTSPTITTPALTLTSSASPAPAVEGRIEWDSDDDRIIVGNGATATTFFSGAHTVETNDLTAAVTWANVPDANVSETSVVQHAPALRTTLQENGSAEMFGETLGTGCADGQVLKANATGGLDCAADISGGGGTPNVLDLADDDVNESSDLVEIATTGDTNGIFSEPSPDKLLINVGGNWPTSDNALEVTCTGCVSDAELATDYISEVELDTESELQGQLTDVQDVATDNDAAHEQIFFERSGDILGSDSLKFDGSAGALAVLGSITASVDITATGNLSGANLSGTNTGDEALSTSSAGLDVLDHAVDLDLTPSAGSATLIQEEDALQVKYDATLSEGGSGLTVLTAPALSANGANCPAGQAAGGIDAAGAAESCLDPVEESEFADDFTVQFALKDLDDLIDGTTYHRTTASEVTKLATVEAGADNLDVEEAGVPTATTLPVLVDSTDINFGINDQATDRIFATVNEAGVVQHAGAIRTTLQENGSAEMTLESLGTACSDGQLGKANATGGVDCAADDDSPDDDSEVPDAITIAGGSVSTSSITLVGSASPTPTVEGRIEWDADDDRIVVGDGAAQATFFSGAHTVDTNTNCGTDIACTFTDDTWAATAVSTQYGGTGVNLSASTGVLRVSSGTASADADISHLAASTSANLRATLTDETGGGAAVFSGGDIGAATATTPPADDSDTSVATTAYVQGEINGAGGRSLTAGGGSLAADAELYTEEHCIYLEDPVTNEELYTLWRAPVAVTITELYCEVTGGTSVAADFEVDDGTPAGVNGSEITCTTSGVVDNTLAGDTTLAAGDRLDLDLGTVTGAVDALSMCFRYTKDD